MFGQSGDDPFETRKARFQASSQFFSSELDLDEVLLLEELGITPVATVMGSAAYHVGFQFRNLLSNQELEVLSQAVHEVRLKAMNDIIRQATELGADGIVSIALRVTQAPWDDNIVVAAALGTSVRCAGGWPSTLQCGRPFTTNLSGPGLWKLFAGGWLPGRVVWGVCVHQVGLLSPEQLISQIGRSREIESYGDAYRDAYQIANERMEEVAASIGAHGVVATSMSEGYYKWPKHVIEFRALGTAVYRAAGERPKLPAPQMTMGLSGMRVQNQRS